MAFYPPNSGGGGGGSPGGPDTAIQYNNAGSFFGDALATRDPSTNVTLIGREVSPTLIQGFEISDTLAGVLDGTVITTADLAQNTAGFMGVFDSTPFGGGTVNAGTIAQDGIGNFQTLILSPNPLGGGNLRGSITDGVTEGRLNLAQDLAEIAWNDGTNRARIFANSNYAILQWNVPGPDFGWGIDATGVALFNGTTPVYRMPMSVSGASAGDVMTYDGLGNVTFQPVASGSIGGSIVGEQIAYGTGIDIIGGSNAFRYDSTNINFIQTVPTNNGNGGTTTSPLQFGVASFVGSGLDDLTLTWDSTIYKSKKYGGNLQVQITQTSPDQFSWSYTGSYSETIGSGTDVSITPGLAQTLFDSQGRHIADITFTVAVGHTMGDRWNAGTSLSTYQWGSVLTDGDHQFMVARPVVGQFYGGDAQYLLDLGGSGTRWEVADQLGEFSIYAPRYFRVEAPGGNTAVLADMDNDIWRQYTNGFYIRNTGDTNTWFTTDGNGGTTLIGNVSGAGQATLFSVNDASRLIDGYVEDAFGGYYGLQLNGSTQVGGLYSNDGVDYTGLIRATNTSTYIQSQDSNTGLINVWQTTATSALGQSTDGVDSITLQLNPTNATITGLTNSTQFLVDDFNEQVIANVNDSFQVRDLLGATWLNINAPGKFGLIGDNTNTKAYLSVDSVSNIITIDSKNGSTVTGDTQNSGNFTKTTVDDASQKFTFATGGSDRFIAYKDWTFIGGAVVHGSIQSYTSTGSVSINDNVSTLQYNPASVNATATITLPATSGGSGSIVTIVFGGTITSGNPVVTTLSWAAGSGNTLVASNLPTTANAGDSVSFQKIGAFWYQINK